MHRWTHLAVACVLLAAAPSQADAEPFQSGKVLAEWVVLGPLPNPIIPLEQRTGPVDGAGFDRDFLLELGGEAQADLADGAAVTCDGEVFTARAIQAPSGQLVDFLPLFNPSPHKVAYACCTVTSDRAQRVFGLFGSDDRAMVWVNGQRVHRFDASTRGVVFDQDQFAVDLQPGDNRVLVKVENNSGGWGFVLRLVDEPTYRASVERAQRVALIRQLQEEQLLTEYGGQLIVRGRVSPTHWTNPQVLTTCLGDYTQVHRWFDRDGNEVAGPTTPGRYALYTELTAADGRVVRRATTFFASSAPVEPWRLSLTAQPAYVPELGVPRAVWDEQSDALSRFGGESMAYLLDGTPHGAAFLAALDDRQRELDAGQTDPPPAWLNWHVRDQEYHLMVKAKVLGVELKQPLAEPRVVEGEPATVLHTGTSDDAGFDAGLSEALEPLLQAWANDTGVPFTFLVARHGVIVHHGAYGSWQGEPATTQTPFDVASISKLMTGSMLAQCLDQGLIELDAPMGRYLPDLPTEGDKVMTVRMGMTHMAGTENSGMWGELNNPWLENNVAIGLETYEPGVRYQYNGLSLNLVARCMEMTSGKSFIRLVNEHLFGPLGMTHTWMFDTAYGTRTTAEDLAHLGQMLLNEGRYGDRVFFSPQTLHAIQPVRLADHFPRLADTQREYGLGNTWASPAAFELDKPPFSERTLTHGSATASVLLIDYENDMIIAMARPDVGDQYSEHYRPVLEAIARFRR